MTLLDYCDPISKPVSKHCVFLDAWVSWLSWANIHTTGWLRVVELGVLTGRTPKRAVTGRQSRNSESVRRCSRTLQERLNCPAQILWKMCCLLRSERYPGKIRTEYPRRLNWLSGSTVFQDPSIMIRCNYAALFLLTIGVSAIAALDSKIAA